MGVLKKVTGDVGCKMGGCKIGVKGPKSCFSENGGKKKRKKIFYTMKKKESVKILSSSFLKSSWKRIEE